MSQRRSRVVVSERVPPQALEAEVAVLGAILQEKEAFFKVLEILRPSDFFFEKHQLIFDAAIAVHKRGDPVDVISLKDELSRRKKLEEVGGASYLTSLVDAVPTAANEAYYARIVREKWERRRLIADANRLVAKAYDDGVSLDQLDLEVRRLRSQGDPTSDARTLLERVGRVRRLHPAQDFIEGILYYGIPAGDHLLFVTSERKLLRMEQLPDGIQVDRRSFDLCRFSKEGILGFLDGASVKGCIILRALEAYFKRFVVFRDPRLPLLLATWTMGTYVYRVFRVFPYLALRSPTKRCGKSRVLDLLSLVAFNATSRVTNPTEAQLFRGPSRNGGTLLLDEVEHLRGSKEIFDGLLAVLNSGFERGGVVTRLQKVKDRFEEITFETYAPRALSGISRLAETLEDRSIIIFMNRKLKSEHVERLSPGRLEQEAQQLRDACYAWALSHAADLAEVYETDAFPGLEALDDRAKDLWEPLLAIALLADEEAEEAGETPCFAETLTALARDFAGIRDEGDTTTVRLIEALTATVEVKKRELFTPSELLKRLQAEEGLGWITSTRVLAALLNPLGLFALKRRREGKIVRAYSLTPEVLDDLKSRYGEGSPEAGGDGEER